jgi:hypothetical protein
MEKFPVGLHFLSRMAALNNSDRLEKWHTTLQSAQRCLHAGGCLVVLCDEGQCDEVKGILKDKLRLHVHHNCTFMTMPYLMVSCFSCPVPMKLKVISVGLFVLYTDAKNGKGNAFL